MPQLIGNDIIIGRTGDGQPLTLTREQRARQVYIAGATGTGKSKLVEHMIRQDLLAWPRWRCGVVVLDPHGSLYDGLMTFIAANGLTRLPIVPIDLRRGDMVVSYNALRQRGGDPAVIVGALVRAIIHAWGQPNTDQTPRLAKWLTALLGLIYERGGTLVDALPLLTQEDVRRSAAGDLRNLFARAVWEGASGLKAGDFQEQVESTFNRLGRLLDNLTMRACLCQHGPSLDLSRALEQGWIILVSLATAGAHVDETDARTFGSMLLSDLWTAACCRGKRDEGAGGVRPCYLYVDEFQSFVNPTIAAALDQARGFGIHATLCQQYPSQLLDRGEIGRMIYNSVMANTRTKIVFQLDHPEDLAALSLWLGRNSVDIDQVKHQHYSTKVMGHNLQYLPSYSESHSEGEAEASGTGTGISNTEGAVTSHSYGVSSGTSEGSGSGVSDGQSWVGEDAANAAMGLVGNPQGASHGENAFTGQSHAEGMSEAWSESEISSKTVSRSKSQSKARSRSSSSGTTSSPMLMPVMGQEASPPLFRAIEEQLFRFTQWLSSQRDRHCMVRLAGTTLPVAMVTPTVNRPLTTRLYVTNWILRRLGMLEFALPMEEALKRVESRRLSFPAEALALPAGGEPVTVKRRLPRRDAASPRE